MKLTELYKEVFNSCVKFAVYGKTTIVSDVRKLLPELKAFTEGFVRENKFQIDNEDYEQLVRVLLDIMKDIIQGIDQEDNILLEDTCEFGLKPFLEMFFSEEALMSLRKEVSDGQ